MSQQRVLVACIGNVFLGDDGFGPAVAAALQEKWWPAQVQIVDFGIRSMDLAFALSRGDLGAAILVDAVGRGGTPGTLYMLEPAVDELPPVLDNHAMDPVAVLRVAKALGKMPTYLRVLGCEPERLGKEDGDLDVGLSDPVKAAVAPAVAMLTDAIAQLKGSARA